MAQTSNHEVTYSSLRLLQSPSESQSRLRCDATQRPRKAVDKEFSVPWNFIAVILGIFCFLLLMTVVVLGTKIFQYFQEKHQQQEILGNLIAKYHIMQKDSYLKQQLLANKSLEYESLKNKTLQLESIDKNRCNKNIEIFSKCLQNAGVLSEDHFFCYGVKYYNFTKSKKSWKECKQACQKNGWSLLKLDGKDEQVFLRQQACKNNYWIGLSYDEGKGTWEWIDGDTSRIYRPFMKSDERGNCAFLTATRVESIDCSKTYNCICEKRIDSI